MTTRLIERCFKGMGGAYAALFTPYDAKGRVNPEMIVFKRFAALKIAKAGQAR